MINLADYHCVFKYDKENLCMTNLDKVEDEDWIFDHDFGLPRKYKEIKGEINLYWDPEEIALGVLRIRHTERNFSKILLTIDILAINPKILEKVLEDPVIMRLIEAEELTVDEYQRILRKCGETSMADNLKINKDDVLRFTC